LSAIFLTDSNQAIAKKGNFGITLSVLMCFLVNGSFTGGGDTASQQREKGANLEVDVPYQYLTFFMEDDEQLKEIGDKYKKGELLSGQVKQILINLMTELVKRHQEARATVSDDVIDAFMSVRKLHF
jgi:tryptophanyl-tRNA synthetase